MVPSSTSENGLLRSYWDGSRTLAAGLAGDRAPDAVLDAIACVARTASGTDAAAVVRASDAGRLWVATADGMPEDFLLFLRSFLLSECTASSAAVTERRTVAVPDIAAYYKEDQPMFADVRAHAARAGLGAVLSVPLVAGTKVLGTLNLYRRREHAWARGEIGLAGEFAEHAASALAFAVADDERRREAAALRRLTEALRQESHEYANRLHAISGLLELGDAGQARAFVTEVTSLHHRGVGAVLRRIKPPTLAGLLLMHMTLAAERGVTLELDPASRLAALPRRVDDVAAVTIVGNLVENAIDAAAAMDAPGRRRAVLRVDQDEHGVTIAVRDFGAGVAPEDVDDVLTLGFSRKPGHGGIGLALLRDRVAAVGGDVCVEHHADGVAFVIRLPHEASPDGV
ncbi:MAG TPA: ATP-binding protein [Baekduia sp.]|jgi:signal transduction histidine kinase